MIRLSYNNPGCFFQLLPTILNKFVNLLVLLIARLGQSKPGEPPNADPLVGWGLGDPRLTDYLNFSRFSLASGVLFNSNSNSLHGKSEHSIQEL